MLIKRPEGYQPVQKKTLRGAVSAPGSVQARRQGGRYDNCTLSAGTEGASGGFLDAVAALSYQVRTNTTTGKIQELRSQVRSGEYQVSPREVAARMLLMEEGE